jgi:thiamine kinase-like enzyme
MTNFIFCLSKAPGSLNERVLLRLYGHGTNRLFSREEELSYLRLLASSDFAPKLWGEFGNGRLEQWLPNKTMTFSLMAQPRWAAMIARKFRVLHDLHLSSSDSGSPPLFIWRKLDDW